MSIANKNKENLLDYQFLQDTLDYCPDTGIFTWKTARGCRTKGSIAGNLQTNGYMQIRLKNKLYLIHRLAWFYCFEEWPIGVIDHIDRDPTNNSLDNLREATQSQNLQNTKLLSSNTSGFRGVSFSKQKQKYEAYISINNKKKGLGLFTTAEEAYQAYLIAANKERGEYINV